MSASSKSPTVATQDYSGEEWNDLANIVDASTTTKAYVILDYRDDASFIFATAFGFTTTQIPLTATQILGIKVTITVGGAHEVTNGATLLTKSGDWGNCTANKAIGQAMDAGSLVFGGASDLWGTYWNISDIRDNANFGVVFNCENSSGGSNKQGQVFHIVAEVTYS